MAKKALVVGPEAWAGALAGELGRLGAEVTVAAEPLVSAERLAALSLDLVVANAGAEKGIWTMAHHLKRGLVRPPVLVLVGPRGMGRTFRAHSKLKKRADAYVPDDRDLAQLATLALTVEPGKARPTRNPWDWAWLGGLAIPIVGVLALPDPVEWALIAMGIGSVLTAKEMDRRAPVPWS